MTFSTNKIKKQLAYAQTVGISLRHNYLMVFFRTEQQTNALVVWEWRRTGTQKECEINPEPLAALSCIFNDAMQVPSLQKVKSNDAKSWMLADEIVMFTRNNLSPQTLSFFMLHVLVILKALLAFTACWWRSNFNFSSGMFFFGSSVIRVFIHLL